MPILSGLCAGLFEKRYISYGIGHDKNEKIQTEKEAEQMNEAQKKVSRYMEDKIEILQHSMHNLKKYEDESGDLGGLYNGILRNNVNFEIQHMEHLKQELLNLLD